MPRCPSHLTGPAAREWRRIAGALHSMGVVTTFDRAALAAYCQAYGRWVEAEERLAETPMLVRTPSGYVQQSPWLGIINKQLELMGRYMTELGLTPASRSRVVGPSVETQRQFTIVRRIVSHVPIGRDSATEPDEPMDADAWIKRFGTDARN
jgi:P27 family predicted phage terminase small subunit